MLSPKCPCPNQERFARNFSAAGGAAAPPRPPGSYAYARSRAEKKIKAIIRKALASFRRSLVGAQRVKQRAKIEQGK